MDVLPFGVCMALNELSAVRNVNEGTLNLVITSLQPSNVRIAVSGDPLVRVDG